MELNFVFHNFSQVPPKGNTASPALQNHPACGLFKEACLRGRIRRLWAWITRRPCRMQSLEDLCSYVVWSCT